MWQSIPSPRCILGFKLCRVSFGSPCRGQGCMWVEAVLFLLSLAWRSMSLGLRLQSRSSGSSCKALSCLLEDILLSYWLCPLSFWWEMWYHPSGLTLKFCDVSMTAAMKFVSWVKSFLHSDHLWVLQPVSFEICPLLYHVFCWHPAIMAGPTPSSSERSNLLKGVQARPSASLWKYRHGHKMPKFILRTALLFTDTGGIPIVSGYLLQEVLGPCVSRAFLVTNYSLVFSL